MVLDSSHTCGIEHVYRKLNVLKSCFMLLFGRPLQQEPPPTKWENEFTTQKGYLGKGGQADESGICGDLIRMRMYLVLCCGARLMETPPHEGLLRTIVGISSIVSWWEALEDSTNLFLVYVMSRERKDCS